MKVVLINHSDTQGGASVVTRRLCEALRAEGVDARMLVVHKNTDLPWVVQAAPEWRTKLPFLVEHLQIFTHNGFNRSDLFKASIATVGLPLASHPLVREADAVMLNWVNQGMLSLDEIGKIAAAKPTVWTMHDMWNMTGICHHAARCERYLMHCRQCHLLHAMASDNDLSARTFDRKSAMYGRSGITFVAVSSWLAERARQSALLRDQRVEVIHNAFPVEEYGRPASRTRAELGLSEDRKLIVFCAARIDDPIKGLPDAVAGLNELAGSHGGDACAVFVGDCRSPQALSELRLPYVQLGPVSDPTVIHDLMAHATAVLSTSSYESLPTTLIEGQAAGATPVGYVHDGRADIITDGVSGYAITDSTADALRRALEQPISAEELRKAASRFSCATIARKYLDLLKQ